MLDIASNNKNECRLILSDEPFEGADVITLISDLSDSVGGVDYFMESFKGKVVNQNIWLCSVSLNVFGSLPQKIFVSS